jgi:flagellin
MRAQITGLEVAQKNAKDGISLVQTAEGALTEVHSMLNRMYELAEQSANGTYAGVDNSSGSNAIDRAQLQKEVTALRDEINRISSTANFNGVQLFSAAPADDSSSSPSSPSVNATIENFTAGGTGFTGATVSSITDSGLLDKTVTITSNDNGDGWSVSVSGYSASISGSTLSITPSGGGTAVASISLAGTGDPSSYGTATFKIAGGGGGAQLTAGTIQLQIGAESDTKNLLTLPAMDMTDTVLKFDSASVDISTQQKALDSLANIKNAINVVSGYRGDLGAVQNRLEHTINNLSVMQENMQDAESTIRDTDVASEMMKYTKNSILVQSAQAMLAQANQQPQGVLQLLQ